MEPIRIGEEVRSAVAERRPVVALETSVLAQGLPHPYNVQAARRCSAAVRKAGAVPAIVGVIAGQAVVGLSDAEVARLTDAAGGIAKAGARDLAPALEAGRDAGTTVSATVALAARAGIQVFATGGFGGVHRVTPGASPSGVIDVSADLGEIARRRVCVVSSGPKAVLDLPATAEALETLGIPAVGWRTSEMPAFYTAESGIPLEHRVGDAEGAARLIGFHWRSLGFEGGVLVLVPPPEPLPREAVEMAIAAALEEARRRGVQGKAVTPFLLASVARATQGRALAANLALLERNAGVAAEIAAALRAAN